MNDSNRIVIVDNLNVGEYFRQTREYIFCDYFEVVPGESAAGYKIIKPDEWYFAYHFPNNPLMPGVFQMEAMMQAGGLIINTLPGKKDIQIYFHECKEARVYKSVRPDDYFAVKVKMLQYKRGLAKYEAEASVNRELSMKMCFSHVVPSELIGG